VKPSSARIGTVTEATLNWPPHEESNLDFRFRRPVFYPLNYGEAKPDFTRLTIAG
jgi:hypothetical protein